MTDLIYAIDYKYNFLVLVFVCFCQQEIAKESRQLWHFWCLNFCSCSVLITEHSTQKNNGQSLSQQGLSKKKKKTLLGSPSQDVEAGFSLGGPATDKYGRYMLSSHAGDAYSVVRVFSLWEFVIDHDYFIYPPCITCWLDVEHEANEAGRGIALPRWALLVKLV